jgi:hypothetical protein
VKEKVIKKTTRKNTGRKKKRGLWFCTSSNRIAKAAGRFCGRGELLFTGELLHIHTQCC